MKQISLLIIIVSLYCCGAMAQNTDKVIILHTNDTHSRIEAMPSNDRSFPGMGGYQLRANLIDGYRKAEPELLLFDAGDFCQGTPYFNLFKGRLEIKLMNAIGYHAVALGNHEFDNGLDSLKAILDEAQFPIVCCNLDFSETVLKDNIRPYIIFEDIKGLKIGVVGATVNPHGLVAQENFVGVKVLPGIETINHHAEYLKKTEHCDLIICLSHLGLNKYDERPEEPYDIRLAQESEHIDIIIGGHSHTYLEEPLVVKNRLGKDVLINQEGKNGVFVGKIEVEFERK